MCTGEPASIMLGTVEDLPQIYADMEQQFPPDEMYKYKNLLHLLHGDKYKILLYKRDSDGELLGYAAYFSSLHSYDKELYFSNNSCVFLLNPINTGA